MLISAAMAAGLFAAASACQAQETRVAAPQDWGQALREDAQAFHDLIADSHPGPVDAENPGFNPLLEAGLATALTRAATADSYQDWYFALQEYASSFDDGHLGLSRYASMGHVWTARWPGFLTGMRRVDGKDQHTVAFSQDPAAPPVGAVLVSCDGRPAEALAQEVIGRAAGRWNLTTQRVAYASTLFIDQTNPYVAVPRRCDFTVDGQTRTWDLAWRDLPDATGDEGFAAARSPRYTTPIGLRRWDHGVWIGLGGFDGDPASEDGLQLEPLKAEIVARAAEIRAAPVVVFDLRGNNGGSSAWITAMATTLWGEARVEEHRPRSIGVDWRTSDRNLETIESYRAQLGGNPDVLAWLNEISAGMIAARAEGKSLWRQAGGDDPTASAAPTENLMKGRVYVLSDYGCASACLDAVDLLTALGAVQVGQETSADTVYMEIRRQPLPGGRVTAHVPMKVYRGRARGNNVTAVPAHEWTGALSDTAGLEAWIAGLAEVR